MNNSITTDFVTVGEIAQILKVSPGTIYYWVSRKEIPYQKIGRHLRFSLKKVFKHFNMIHQDDAS